MNFRLTILALCLASSPALATDFKGLRKAASALNDIARESSQEEAPAPQDTSRTANHEDAVATASTPEPAPAAPASADLSEAQKALLQPRQLNLLQSEIKRCAGYDGYHPHVVLEPCGKSIILGCAAEDKPIEPPNHIGRHIAVFECIRVGSAPSATATGIYPRGSDRPHSRTVPVQ